MAEQWGKTNNGQKQYWPPDGCRMTDAQPASKGKHDHYSWGDSWGDSWDDSWGKEWPAHFQEDRTKGENAPPHDVDTKEGGHWTWYWERDDTAEGGWTWHWTWDSRVASALEKAEVEVLCSKPTGRKRDSTSDAPAPKRPEIALEVDDGTLEVYDGEDWSKSNKEILQARENEADMYRWLEGLDLGSN
jgi:hypothetical protein